MTSSMTLEQPILYSVNKIDCFDALAKNNNLTLRKEKVK